jgi:hypothetical protein
MEQCWIDNRRGETEVLIERLPQFNFVHNISHLDFFWIESCFLKEEILANNKMTYQVSHKPRLNILYKRRALYCSVPLTSLFTLWNAGSDEMALRLAMKFQPK